jgi:hypothetical protein
VERSGRGRKRGRGEGDGSGKAASPLALDKAAPPTRPPSWTQDSLHVTHRGLPTLTVDVQFGGARWGILSLLRPLAQFILPKLPTPHHRRADMGRGRYFLFQLKISQVRWLFNSKPSTTALSISNIPQQTSASKRVTNSVAVRLRASEKHTPFGRSATDSV